MVIGQVVRDHDFALSPGQRAMVSATKLDPAAAQFYAARHWRPLWFNGARPRPETTQLIAQLRAAATDGLDPKAYQAGRLATLIATAPPKDVKARARVDVALSVALAHYVGDLRRPPPGGGMYYADPALPPPPVKEAAVLTQAASAPSLGAWLASVRNVNPIYDQLRDARAAYRAAHPGAPDAHEILLALNMERARALPANLGDRYILVNAPSARLWAYDHGRAQETMEVVAGKTTDQTPLMVAQIRWAVLNPYWNVPPDLAQNRFAPKVLQVGPGFLTAEHYQVMSDFTQNATPVDPATVDWVSVETGQTKLRMRQLPGPDNTMGAIKFMLPNPLGVYLHDTAERKLFAKQNRFFSAGCVRLEQPGQLARWLFGRPLAAPRNGPPEQRVDLARPVPVYLVYFTALPTPTGMQYPADVYGRDAPMLRALRAVHRL
ncbi:MAG TPA: L,D-transpeptidase family protein [Caulobacteraceae bacterium]|jgi:murein L,D-transpeptidase YcbB/YkuD|nr:L,D-transpeptidase family protein [Caulobacteraceae bacterium]